MRRDFDPQNRMDRPTIAEIDLNTKCRDRIVPILRALQGIYQQPEVLMKIMALVEGDVVGKAAKSAGRPGMDLWQILVLACVRLGCNFTYDHLQDLAENHRSLRMMMGIGKWDEQTQFDWRRIEDNLLKLKPETILAISDEVVRAGHREIPAAACAVRGDTFVTRTNIHYPTDSSLISDGLRKLLELCSELAASQTIAGWRQHVHLSKTLRSLARGVNLAARSRCKQREEGLRESYTQLFAFADDIMTRALALLGALPDLMEMKDEHLLNEIVHFLSGTAHIADYARRRILKGEQIDSCEKIFSLFEPHTEMINRGKTPQPVEFGHKVLVVEDAAGLIVHAAVLANGTSDRDALVPTMEAVCAKLGKGLESASWDRGFHSPENQRALADMVETPCLAASGSKLHRAQMDEASDAFRAARQAHPGIESAIGALQFGNALDRCRDRTLIGYHRYVALAILGRNMLTLGKHLIARDEPGANAAHTRRLRRRAA